MLEKVTEKDWKYAIFNVGSHFCNLFYLLAYIIFIQHWHFTTNVSHLLPLRSWFELSHLLFLSSSTFHFPVLCTYFTPFIQFLDFRELVCHFCELVCHFCELVCHFCELVVGFWKNQTMGGIRTLAPWTPCASATFRPWRPLEICLVCYFTNLSITCRKNLSSGGS